MTTRFKAGDQAGVPSGYEGSATPDLFIPSCGIEDVDKALFSTLKDGVAFQVSDNTGGNQRPVPMVFAVGEKWSMLKSGRAIRDRDGTLILPLVTVRRTGIEQNSKDDITGRGMNQHVGEIMVKHRLDSRDRAYQNLINKSGIPNAVDVPGDRLFSPDGTVTTARDDIRANAKDIDVKAGGLLAPKLGTNVWEIITIPTPQFFTATYEMTIWAQYTQHMNMMLEKLMSSYLPTGNRTLKLETTKGYWFVAYFDEGYASDDNVDNSSGAELTRKYKFTIKVPGYLVLSNSPSVPTGIRKFVSAPQLIFASGGELVDTTLVNGIPTSDPYEGADDPSLLLLLTDPAKHSSTRVNHVSTRVVTKTIINPFTGRRDQEFARVVSRNPATGETLLKPDDGLGIAIISSK